MNIIESLMAGLLFLNPAYADTQPKLVDRMMEKDAKCLAMNMYHEARNQTIDGQYAVAHVTMNRVASSKHADNICDVVYANKQFSWTWTLTDTTPDDQKAYDLAYTIASEVISNQSNDNTNGADHYHADYVNPFWATEEFMIKTAQIDNHIFYKAK